MKLCPWWLLLSDLLPLIEWNALKWWGKCLVISPKLLSQLWTIFCLKIISQMHSYPFIVLRIPILLTGSHFIACKAQNTLSFTSAAEGNWVILCINFLIWTIWLSNYTSKCLCILVNRGRAIHLMFTDHSKSRECMCSLCWIFYRHEL